VLSETRRRATERHLPYGITQCYLPPPPSIECSSELLLMHTVAGVVLARLSERTDLST